MDDQRSFLLRREGLRQDCRRRGFWLSLKELVNLSVSQTILRVVIVTIDKARVARFALIPVFNRRGFGLLIRIVIFTLLILASPFLRFVLTGRRRLNSVHFRGFTGGRSRRQSILNIRRIEFRGRVRNGMWLSMSSPNHTIGCM
jgi:hypothetical protein